MNYKIIAVLLIALGAAARLFPHPANVAPIAAIALFGGMYLPKRYAVIAPLIALVASDFIIGFYSWPILLTVYGSFVLTALIGLWIRRRRTFTRVLGGAVFGSILFFLTTNAAVWAFGAMYPHTIGGLLESYTMAIPFFRNSLLGDLFYVGILVGSMEFLLRRSQLQRVEHSRMN